MAAAIEVDGVWKRFRLDSAKASSLKERAIGLVSRRRRHEADAHPFWALQDISFEVEQGHTVGLLGHNGSGKSTLLKCTGGILQPTRGEIRTRGRLASLLELGAGFHPDLTGRENVYLNASILGLSRKDIDARFDDIVGFAELERFIDQQVKHYSSGMYMRLGFSVATNVEPDVLLIDEVLAVGDESFQRKCYDRIKQFQRDGRTIVFVTHAPDLVRQICDRAVVLDHGNMVVHGTPSDAVRLFRENLIAGEHERAAAVEHTEEPTQGQRVRIRNVAVDYGDDRQGYVRSGEPLTVRIAYEAVDPVPDSVFVVTFHTQDGHVVWGNNTWAAGHVLPPLQGMGEVAFRFPAVPLLEGTYPLTVGVHGLDGVMHDWREQHEHVTVVSSDGEMAWGIAALPLEVDLSRLAAAKTAEAS
jgi:ABC-2 type transport system ATP-binding protein